MRPGDLDQSRWRSALYRLEAINGRASRLDRFAIIRALVEHLTETPAIVVVDESQLLTSDYIELLR